MKKQAKIQIVDAKRITNGAKANAYRVKSVGKNGETLQTSEVLNDVKAVKTHIKAMCYLWESEFPTREISNLFGYKIADHTKLQKFYKSAYALAKSTTK